MKSILKSVALSIPQIRRMHEDRRYLHDRVLQLEGRLASDNASPFYHYNSCFDAIETMKRHAVANLTATPNYLTNYLGVKIDPKFFPQILTDRAGTVEGIPIPANWHADIAEWAAALRAVDLSGETFSMIELGCGWGCWMNNTGVAARNAGKKVRLIGIEGDHGHVEFAVEALKTNGFQQKDFEVFHGIAAEKPGKALFPKQNIPGMTWGLEPVFHATPQQLTEAQQSGNFDILDIINMSDIIGESEVIDLLHIDIQGGEADLVEACIEILNKHVRYVLIGTHSRVIEGRLESMLLNEAMEARD